MSFSDLFSNEDPNKVYRDLVPIGQGAFATVFRVKFIFIFYYFSLFLFFFLNFLILFKFLVLIFYFFKKKTK